MQMRRKSPLTPLLLAVLGFGCAQPTAGMAANDAAWTSVPLLLPAPAKGGDRRTQSLVKPVNLTSEQVMVHPPFQGDSPAEPWAIEAQEGGVFAVKSKGVGNYHWISAASSDGKQFANSVYYFSNPGAAPRQLLQQNLLPLEVKPLALPREHNQYRANDTWTFQTNYQGKPLPNAAVTLATSNGTQQTLTSNAQGQFALTFPDDFKPKAEEQQHHAGGHGGGHTGHGDMEQAQFALSVQHEDMVSAFNYKYTPDAFTNKAVLPAVGFVFAGMLLASPLLLRRRKKA